MRLPHPVIVVSGRREDCRRQCGGEAVLRCLGDIAAPTHGDATWCLWVGRLLTLVDQVRSRGAAVNEYKVDLARAEIRRATGRFYVAPFPSDPAHVVVMLQQRTIADKMDRQLTHRGAARSVTALAASWRTKSIIRRRVFAARLSCSSSRPATTTAR